MFCLEVQKELAEKLRLKLAAKKLIDNRFKITFVRNKIRFPLVKKLTNCELATIKKFGARIIVVPHIPQRYRPPVPFIVIKEKLALRLPAHLLSVLPEKWELFGDVLVLKLPKELRRYRSVVASAYAEVLRAKAVLDDIGGIKGIKRTPVFELIFGSDTETIHKEHGIRFRFDVAKVMFASGNLEERHRMTTLVKHDETIVDLFAGIGYFSVPIAVRSKPKKIFACELNPTAYQYLCENIMLNHVENIVVPLLGDCRKVAPRKVANRVILGYLESQRFLPAAMEILRPEGGIIHYHEACPNVLLPDRPLRRVRAAAAKAGGKAEILGFSEVKSYAPGVTHIVVDAKIVRV